MKTKHHILFLLCLSLLLFACNKGEVYYQFKHIPNAKWGKDNVLLFDIDSTTMDAFRQYNISIELSHNGQYPYQNLWLFVKQNLQDSTFITDTIEIELADIYGKWNGNGSGGIYQLSVPYKKSIAIHPEKRCSIFIRQGMRDEPIKGIEKVGVKIMKQQ